MNQLERYIQFAIDNGYRRFKYEDTKDSFWIENISKDFKTVWLESENSMEQYVNITELITSKDFIESVSIWCEKLWTLQWSRRTNVDYITIKQAIAIRDNTLDTFITALLWTEKKN